MKASELLEKSLKKGYMTAQQYNDVIYPARRTELKAEGDKGFLMYGQLLDVVVETEQG
jgi:hypothetical protein